VIVAAHQPNFLPWLGFFDKLARADVLVLLDDVQFPRSGAGVWTNRVRLLVGGQPRWVTVPIVRAGRGVVRINEIAIDESQAWRAKLVRTIELNYARAARFSETFPFVCELVETSESDLASYNEHNLRLLAKALGHDSEKLRLSSSIPTTARGTDLLIELTSAFGGTSYLSGDGAGAYQDESRFAAAGIELRFQRYRQPTYRQLAQRHVSGLSIIDALLNCGFEASAELVRQASNTFSSP
jgi:hypothetical protein